MAGVGPGRDVAIVDAGARKPLELQVVVPVEDMAAIGEILPPDQQPGGPATSPEARSSIWPSIHPAILELIRAHRSTIVFVNSRRLSERLAQRLNELAGEELVKAHHGSIAREQRLAIEEELKAGRLPALVATSSLELGIDMGAVDLVIQVESPTSVARGLQRVGRAGHQVGAPEQGRHLPEVPRRPARSGRRRPADARGRHRDDPHPAQPARRPRPATGRDDGHGSLDRGRPARHDHPRRAVRDAHPRRPRGRARACSPAPTRPTSSPN